MRAHKSIRSRQARLLTGPSLRTIRWVPLTVIAPIGFAIVYAGLHRPAVVGEAHFALSGILLAVWMGFLLDDPAAATVAATPTPLLFRRAIRIAMTLPVVLALWELLMVYADLGWKNAPLTAAFGAQLLVALGFAAVGVRAAGEERGGPIAVGGLSLAFFVLPLLFRWNLFLDREKSSWNHLYGRWVAIGVLGLLAFLVASSGLRTYGPAALVRGIRGRPAVTAREAPS